MTMNLQQPEDLTGSQDAEQSNKPLGRGLEQISHLFLSQKSNSPRPGDTSPGRLPQPAPGGTTLLQPTASVSKDRLVAVLKDNPGALEDGLRVIDTFIPCYPHSDINLLALNRANQLTAIDLETGVSDALVLRGLVHCEWLKHNVPNIRRMFPQQNIVVSSQPRLFLIAPKFSALALHAVPQLSSLQIYCIRYHAFDIGGVTGISFEPLTSE
jgi:hypothetical protein